MCDPPPSERLARNDYKIRQDCGSLVNATDFLPGALDIPLVQLNRPAIATRPFTNACCELNMQKPCIDAIENKDYMYYAKGINLNGAPDAVKHYDGQYCLMNGFLQPEYVRMSHDFQAMQAAAAELCSTKYAREFNISAITLREQQLVYFKSISASDTPSLDVAEFIAAWNCAMGDLACDLTYCTYTYCDLGNGATGVLGECDGWDKVLGMPTFAKPGGVMFMVASWIGVVAGIITISLLVVVAAFKCHNYACRGKARTRDLGMSLAGDP